MILAYQLLAVDRLHVGLRCYSLDIREGDRWVGTPYPLRVDSILAGKVKGIRVTGLDGKILMSMQMHQKIGGQNCLFQGMDSSRLTELLLKSKRAYPEGKNPPPLTFAPARACEMRWQVRGEGYQPDIAVEPQDMLIPGRPCYILNTESGKCAALKSKVPEAAVWKWVTSPVKPTGTQGVFWEKISAEFPDTVFPSPPDTKIKKIDHLNPAPVLEFMEADTNTKLPESVRISFEYGPVRVQAESAGSLVRWVEETTITEARRALTMEKVYLQEMQAKGLVPYQAFESNLFTAALSESRFVFDSEKFSGWAAFFASVLPDLEIDGWKSELPARFAPKWIEDENWYTDFHEKGTGSLRYEQGIEVDGKRINLLPLLHAFLKQRRQKALPEILSEIGENYFPLPSDQGLLMISGSRFQQMVQTLFELFGDGVLDRDHFLRVSPWRAVELHHEDAEGWHPPEKLQKAMEALRGEIDIDPLAAPPNFQGELRDYQKQGLGWIDFLSGVHLGGILADDMGLGKTVQVIAAFLRMREMREQRCRFLVVCPASVLPNWRTEIKRFAPSLSVHTHHGTERHQKSAAMDESDVLLTTYGTLLRDEAAFRAIPFTVVVLDEAQAVKNPKARISKMVCGLQAELRLALSGTPLENHLGELWSLFHFVMPGYLGTEKMFNAVLRKPIEQEHSSRAKALLHRKIAPLLLRRSKDLVAGELPPKTEIIQEISLSTQQADLYEVVRAAGEAQIRETLQEQGFERSQIQVLDLLLKLRQICCDPRLCKSITGKTTAAHSAKLQWLREVLPEMMEEGRRVLLFSQFTSMLNLIKTEVNALKIPYVEIRGSTRDREAPVKRFQNGEVPLFLISLKAGGTGLNLTAADTVIFFDPWWNPAAEAQAADRAHRIGQDKPVFVYKLICAGTVESRILELQERKKELQALLDDKAEGGTKKFTEEDFKTLMAPLSVEST